jgi:hypothetical protein
MPVPEVVLVGIATDDRAVCPMPEMTGFWPVATPPMTSIGEKDPVLIVRGITDEPEGDVTDDPIGFAPKDDMPIDDSPVEPVAGELMDTPVDAGCIGFN